MKKPKYTTHNTVYYPMIKRLTARCTKILDVGCGDGSLVGYLDEKDRHMTGVDPDPDMIKTASSESYVNRPDLICDSFEGFSPESSEKFDAVVFVASLHHMDMEKALIKAKKLLSENGMIIVVGLSKPSSALDHIIEGLRVVPCFVLTKALRMKTSENLAIPTSYDFPKLRDVRDIAKRVLPGYKMRQGLFYRYILTYEKRL